MDEAGRDKLWKNYISTRSAEYRDELIVEYAQLVKLVAGRLNMYLGYNVEYDDLVGYGIFGLIDAIDKFDYGKNVKFETYASLRIRGAILDQIRKMDWIPRSLRQKQKRIEAAMAKIESETGHIASDEELAAELEITIDELADWQGKMKASNLISLDEYTEAGSEVKMESVGNSHFDQPEEAIEKEELSKLNELNDEIREMGGEVVGINTDTLDNNQDGIKEAKEILKAQGASYKNLTFDSDSTVGKYAGNIMAFPTTVLVDKDGNIVGEPFMGGIDDQSNYDQLMKQIQSVLDQK